MSNRLAFLLVVVVCATPLAAQTIFVSDTFTVSSTQTLQSHTPDTGGAWTRFLGAGVQIANASDDIRPTANGSFNIYGNATVPSSAEYVVGISVVFTASSTNNHVGVFGRGNVASASGYLALVRSNGSVELYVVAGGTPTLLANSTIPGLTLNATHFVVFSIRNSAKQVYVDGVLRASSANNTVTANGIVGLTMQRDGANRARGDNFFAGTFAPTAVERLDAEAVRDQSGRTLITWQTAGEAGNIGFRVHRQIGDRRELVTPSIVAGSAFLAGSAMLSAGNTYRWSDDGASEEARYWIEEIDIRGKRTWHGPIVPAGGTIDERVPRARTLRELTKTGVAGATRSSQVESLTLDPATQASSVSPKQLEIAAGNAVKIHVGSRGWHRVTQAELRSAGLPANVDPRGLALFADGKEVAITVEGENDGRLDASDAIRFHGIPLDSQWSAARVYWLVPNTKKPARIGSEKPEREKKTSEQTSFRAVVERRDKVLFFASLLKDEGDGFFGPVVSGDGPALQSLVVSAPAASNDAQLTITVQGGTEEIAHSVRASINGHVLGTIDFFSQEKGVGRFSVPASLLADGDNQVSLEALNGLDDISVIESLRLVYSRSYRVDTASLLFTVDNNKRARLTGLVDPDLRLLDVTDPANPIEVGVQSDASGVWAAPPGRGARTLLALVGSQFAGAERVEANEPSRLHATSRADVVIITHPDFAAAAETLRGLRAGQGLTTIVATTRDVYDEFSFGVKDPSAIKALLSASRKWSRAPRYAVLIGDGSFDSRNYLGLGDADFVPTKLVVADWIRTASDSWLSDFDGDGVSEIAIGRLPARSQGEAATMAGKIVAYETSPAPGTWSQRALLVADHDATIAFEQQMGVIETALGGRLSAERIDVGTMGSAAARAQLLGELAEGASLVGFVGHGSVELWTASGLFNRNDALQMTNAGRLPVVLSMTCLNGFFHDVYTDSLAEALLRSPNGGAVAVWASSAISESEAQAAAGETLVRALLSSPGVRLGDAVLAAQRASSFPEIRKTFLLFGDPAMRLTPGR